jgi:GLPGLI family protein
MNWKILFKTMCVLATLIFNQSIAQNYKIYYLMNYKTDSLEKEIKNKNMVLLIKDDQSKFYSQEQFENDSTVMENRKKGIKSQIKYDYDFTVIKDFKTKKITKFTVLLRDLYKVSDNMPTFNWNINNETKKIAGYNCQKATLNYSGRDWEVWFTTDIAIQEGPSFFNGLPGLIIYMKDTKGNYEFSFTGIKKDEITHINDFSTTSLEITKKQLIKVLIDHYNDPYREMKTGNIKVLWQDENGKQFKPDYNDLTKSEQKHIKKNNNPIELSEAIKYP